ncbi:MAG: TIGR04076 family protein [candidate division Zixibacteria bacterium]|nr:TIGR04076 family protein [candidate division Zixibacteria bacterium]
MDYIIDIEIKEIRGQGTCPSGHKIGEVFHMGDGKLCPWATHTIMPFATALRFGGEVPWRDKDKDKIEISCPDPDNVVVFRLSRRPKTEGMDLGW